MRLVKRMGLVTSKIRQTMKRLRDAGGVRAGLLAAALLTLVPAGVGQALNPGGPADFGSVAVGAPARQVSLTFSASVTTMIQSVIATTDGVQNKDFTIIFQTCTGTQSPPQSCTITIGFSPLAPGLRKGALSIVDSTGTVVNRVFLHGIGLGEQIVVSPAMGTALSSASPLTPATFAASGSATDGGGDIYFNDSDFQRILEKDSTGALSQTASLLSTANSGMAIDGAGTLYIAAGTLVYSLVPGGVATPVATGSVTLTNATGLVVDGSGFLYIADSGQNHIVRVGQDGTTSVLALSGLSTALLQPHGLAVDTNNLYIADTGNNRVVVAGLFSGVSTVLVTAPVTLSEPKGVSVDAAGDLAIADTGNKRVVVAPVSGAAFVLQAPGVTFGNPVSIRIYDNGDLLVADTQVGLVTLARSAATLNFPTGTGVGHLDTTDGALPFNVLNSGNVALQLTVPATGANPLVVGDAFATTATSTCSLVTSASPANATTQLTVGEACNYTVSFTPTVVGPNTGTATVTAAPVGGGTTMAPVVTLNGTGNPNITKFKVVLSPTVTQPGVPVTMTVSALDINGVVDPTYLGTATFTSTDPAITFAGGTTYTFTAADAGVHVFTGTATGVRFNTLGAFTVTATDGIVTGVSANELVEWADAFSLVASPTTVELGAQVTLTVTATFHGVVAPQYTGMIVFSSSDPLAVFVSGGSYTFTAADNGTHTFTIPNGVQLNTVGLQTISATAGVITGISNQVNVVAADSFTITASPTTLFVGQNAGYTITALFHSVVATNFTGTVSLATTDAGAKFVGSGTDALTYTFTAADQGVHTVTPAAGVQFNTAGTQTISVTSGSLTATSNTVLVLAADGFTITAAPSPILVGQSVGYIVTAVHQGTTVTNYTGTVTFTTTDTSAKFASTGTNTFSYTFTAADNGTHTFAVPAVQFNTAGTYTVNATAGVLTAKSNDVVVLAADSFTITAAPATLLSGQSAGYTVTAMYLGAPVTGFTGTVTFTTTDTSAKFASTGTNTFTYTFTAVDNGTRTFPIASGVQFNSGGTFTIHAADGAITGVSNNIVVVGLDGFTITAAPATLLLGQSTGYTVTAMYKGAATTGFAGTVTFTTTDTSAKFASTGSNTFTYTFTAADNGTHTFAVPAVQFNTAGTYTIHAADGAVTGVSNNIVVVPADAFAITAAPATLQTGQSAGYMVTAMFQGAPVTGFLGTVTFTTTDTSAKFASTGTNTFTYTFTAADNGTHTFSVANGVQFNTGGTFTIHAADGAVTGVSNNIVVAGLDGFTITAAPSTLLLGQSAGYVVTAMYKGAASTGFLGTVTFTTTDTSAKFASTGTNTFTYTFTAADNGTHTFAAPAVQFNTVGTFTVNAASGANTGVSNQVHVVAADGFTITAAPSTLLLGQSAGYTVTAMYQGAPVTGFVGPVTFTTTDTSAKFATTGTNTFTYTFTAADNGTHTFAAPAVQFDTAGTFTIHAADGTIVGVSNNIVVVAADAFAITAAPANLQAGQSAGYTVTAMYQGAPVTGFTGTVTFTTTDTSAKFASTGTDTFTYTFTAADSGTHVFSVANGVQFNAGGTFTIHAADGTIAGVSNNIVVAGLDGFTITAAPTTLLVGQSAGYTVTAMYKGVASTGFLGTVTFTTTDTSAKFASTGTNTFTYTFTAADNGTHTFAAPAVQFNTAGTFTVNANSGTIASVSNQVHVVVADGFTITAAPTTLLLGQSTGYTVTAMYQGAPVTGFVGPVTFTTTDTAAKFAPTGTNTFTYTFTAADNGSHTFAAPAVQFNTVGTFTIHAAFGAIAGVSNNIVVVAADAFSITATPTTLLTGQSAGYIVTAMYQGAPVTNFTGPVTFTTTDTFAKFASTGTNSYTYTFTAADNGAHTFPVASGVQFNTGGTFTIHAADGTITGVSNNIVVIGLDGFTITAAPTTLLLGQSAGYTVTAVYKGAPATGFTGPVTFTTTDTAAKFASTGNDTYTYTFTAADNGAHTFAVASGVQFNTTGTFTIHATDGTVTGVSNNIVVLGLDGLTITAAPAALLLGQSAGYTVTATYQGAPVTNFTGTVTFSVTDPKAAFLNGTNTYTFTAADNGTHTFPVASGVQFNSLGTFTIHVSDGTITAVSNNVVVTNPTGAVLTSSLNPVLIGTPITLTATIDGATVPPDGMVTFVDNGVPIGTGTVTNGVATLTNVIFTVTGQHPLTAVYSGDPSFNGSTSPVLIQLAEDFTLAIAPGTPSSGSALVGHAATYSLLVSPVGGPTFAAPVTFSLSDELTGAKAVFTPATVGTGTGQTTVSLALTPTQLLGMLHEGPRPERASGRKVSPVALALLVLLPLAGLRRRKHFSKLLLLVVSLLPLTLMTGCLSSATDGYYGQPPGTYTLTVTGTSGTLAHTVQISIKVQ